MVASGSAREMPLNLKLAVRAGQARFGAGKSAPALRFAMSKRKVESDVVSKMTLSPFIRVANADDIEPETDLPNITN